MHLALLCPEIVGRILQYAAPSKLEQENDWKYHLSLLGVCQPWRQIGLPLVYQHVIIASHQIAYPKDDLDVDEAVYTNIELFESGGYSHFAKSLVLWNAIPIDLMCFLDAMYVSLANSSPVWTGIEKMVFHMTPQDGRRVPQGHPPPYHQHPVLNVPEIAYYGGEGIGYPFNLYAMQHEYASTEMTINRETVSSLSFVGIRHDSERHPLADMFRSLAAADRRLLPNVNCLVMSRMWPDFDMNAYIGALARVFFNDPTRPPNITPLVSTNPGRLGFTLNDYEQKGCPWIPADTLEYLLIHGFGECPWHSFTNHVPNPQRTIFYRLADLRLDTVVSEGRADNSGVYSRLVFPALKSLTIKCSPTSQRLLYFSALPEYLETLNIHNDSGESIELWGVSLSAMVRQTIANLMGVGAANSLLQLANYLFGTGNLFNGAHFNCRIPEEPEHLWWPNLQSLRIVPEISLGYIHRFIPCLPNLKRLVVNVNFDTPNDKSTDIRLDNGLEGTEDYPPSNIEYFNLSYNPGQKYQHYAVDLVCWHLFSLERIREIHISAMYPEIWSYVCSNRHAIPHLGVVAVFGNCLRIYPQSIFS